MCDAPRILIVDDTQGDRDMVAQAVYQACPGALVTLAADEAALNQALKTSAFDLVTTDYWLPWGNGLDVIRRVRARWPDCPVVMVTGSGDEAAAVEAMKLGAVDYIVKAPHHVVRLVAGVRSALARRDEQLATRHGEHRYRSLFENLPFAVYRTRMDGTIIDTNQPFAALFGWPDPAAAIGQSVVGVYVTPGDREQLLRDVCRMGEVRNRPVRVRRMDGQEIWINLSVRVLEDRSGEQVMQGVARDITDELAVQQQLLLLASALEAAADAIVVTDPHGVIEWVNPSFTTMTGYSLEEARGQSTRLLKSGTLPPEFYRDMWRTILAGRVWRGEIENRRKDGRVYAEQMSITPVPGQDGAVAHFVAVKRDVSEQRTLEAQFRQAQKMEAIGQLAGGIAHDFNNLMTAILGYCEILLESLLPGDPNRADVLEMRSAGQRASALTRQLLAFSRKQILQPTTFDVRDVVTGLDKMLRRLIREDIAFTIDQPASPLFIRADVGQIEQVIINLAINACDAMPAGGALTVSTRTAELTEDFVRAHPGAVTGRCVAVDVRDTGTGIAPEVLTRVFEPFFTTKPQGKGTGLGLSMVYGIVKQSGGYIAADSVVGQGSVFTMYLPEEAAPAAVEPTPTHPPLARPSAPASILVAEDDATIRDLVCRVLARAGFNVVSGASAREVLESLEAVGRRPDLLLTDLVMPETNGVELARILRARHPSLPVIFMSGYHDPIELMTAGGLTWDCVLPKPLTPEVLLQAVHQSLGMAGAGSDTIRT